MVSGSSADHSGDLLVADHHHGRSRMVVEFVMLVPSHIGFLATQTRGGAPCKADRKEIANTKKLESETGRESCWLSRTKKDSSSTLQSRCTAKQKRKLHCLRNIPKPNRMGASGLQNLHLSKPSRSCIEKKVSNAISQREVL